MMLAEKALRIGDIRVLANLANLTKKVFPVQAFVTANTVHSNAYFYLHQNTYCGLLLR